MTDTLRHRGPDDEGYYVEGNVGFGHRRLSIIDLATGHQPMCNEDGTVWITYNGEVYNYLELRRELLGCGHQFRTSSDTEVVIHAYEEYGARCLDRLNGMFAFAIHDRRPPTTGRSAARLFLARDRFGIKPLYYCVDHEQFLFASEIKALLTYPAVSAQPHWPGLHDYLTFQFCLGDKTLFEGVKRLEPGHYLWLDLGQERPSPQVHRYWALNFEVDTHHTEDYFVDRLMWLLQDAVRLQLRSDVPLGAHLSGGLDTSTVTCIAAPLLGEPLSTFAGGFREGPEYDETAYARLVSQQAGTRHFEVWPTAAEFVEEMPRLIYHMDEPAAGPGLFPQYAVSKLASQHVKVVLGGQGGDEVFGGYVRYLVAYLEQCIKGAVFETQDEGKYVVTLESIIPALPQLQRYLPMMQSFWRDGLFEPMDRRYFRLIDRNSSGEQDALFTPEFLQTRRDYSAFEAFQEIFHNSDTRSYFNKMTNFDIQASLPALLQVEDRTSMAVSLESRVPMLDHRIVELVASMPPTMKFRNGELKYIFKQAGRNLVPAEVLARKDKMGFPVPLAEWYRSEIQDFVMDTLTSAVARERGIYRSENVEAMLAAEGKFDRRIWGLLCLELWFQQFIDPVRVSKHAGAFR
jgi:asparagine synthase (glutamine-hydrolysing)